MTHIFGGIAEVIDRLIEDDVVFLRDVKNVVRPIFINIIKLTPP